MKLVEKRHLLAESEYDGEEEINDFSESSQKLIYNGFFTCFLARRIQAHGYNNGSPMNFRLLRTNVMWQRTINLNENTKSIFLRSHSRSLHGVRVIAVSTTRAQKFFRPIYRRQSRMHLLLTTFNTGFSYVCVQCNSITIF